MRILRGELVKLSENSIRRTMYIDGIGVHAHAASIGSQRLDFIEKHYQRAALRLLGDCLTEQVAHGTLTLAERCSCEGVRLDLDETKLTQLANHFRRVCGQSSGERGLSGARRSVQHD